MGQTHLGRGPGGSARTDLNSGRVQTHQTLVNLDQAEQTQCRHWVTPNGGNRPNSGMGQTEQIHIMYEPDVAAQPSICPEYELGRTGPLVREPGPAGPYLSWVEYFILGYGTEIQIHY